MTIHDLSYTELKDKSIKLRQCINGFIIEKNDLFVELSMENINIQNSDYWNNPDGDDIGMEIRLNNLHDKLLYYKTLLTTIQNHKYKLNHYRQVLKNKES